MALSNYIKITDTPDIKSIEENNNSSFRFVIVNASTNEYRLI